MTRPTTPPAGPYNCPTCGLIHPLGCQGHTNIRDETGTIIGTRECRAAPRRGLTVCVKHGASSPQAKAKSERVVEGHRVQAVIRSTLAEAYGTNVPHIDPADAMLQAVAWKYAEVLALRAKVSELDDKARAWGRTKRKTGGDDAGITREAKPNIWWSELQRAEEQLVRFSKACRDARVDEARVLLAERQGIQVASMIRNVLDGMLAAVDATLRRIGVADEQINAELRTAWAEAMGVIVPEELRRLTDRKDPS